MPHFTYVLIAKARAQALAVVVKVLSIPRPMLYTGHNATDLLCQLLLSKQPRHVLIVTDTVLRKLGAIDKAGELLKAAQVKVTVYDEVTPDPTFAVVQGGLNVANSQQCDAILAIGGGSVIDAAKMIALAQANRCAPESLMGLFKAKRPGTPLYVLPSTSGTGSEATVGAVISNDTTHQKDLCIDPKIVPIAAGIDPELLKGMPPGITADTGIDVLTHALEAWMSRNATSETDYYAATAVQQVLHYLPLSYADGQNLEARQEMGIAAHYAGIALNKAGLGYVHAIAHQLGAFYGVPHGRANAIVLPFILDVNVKAVEARLAELAYKVGMVPDLSADLTQQSAALSLIRHLKQLIKILNISTHIPNMNEKDFDAIIRAVAKEVQSTYAVARYLTPKEIRQILINIKTQS